MTSSPGPMPAASRARCRALVPDVDAHRFLGAAIGCEFLLERRNLAAQRKLAAVENALNGGVNLGFNAGVLRFQINERNHWNLPLRWR